ncbi:MAG TPA: hypothetical protein VF771_11380 [Longimicrobiaceae bacterium]
MSRTVLEPAVYLVAAHAGHGAPSSSYFSELVNLQICEQGKLFVYPPRPGRPVRGFVAVDPSVFKPDPGAHPWGPVPGTTGKARHAPSLTWWPLFANPTHFGERGVSDHPLERDTAWFTAQAHGARCLLEWRNPAVPSPFPGGASRVELAHGAWFHFANRHHVVWVEPAGPWNEDERATPADSQILREIDTLGKAAMKDGAKRFLALPRVSRWWGEELMRQLGFVPFRRNRVPHAEWCSISAVEGGLVLRWTVVVVRTTVLCFFRTLRGADLVALRDAATVLHELYAVPGADEVWDAYLESLEETKAELAFLQVERERLEDPILGNQLLDRIRELRDRLKYADQRN